MAEIFHGEPPVNVLGDIDNGLQLGLANFGGLFGFALFQSFANAEDHLESCVDSSAGLGRDQSRILVEDCTALRVA